MTKKDKLVVLGDSAFAEVAYEYFTCDSGFEVVAFSVERAYVRRESLLGLPVVPFEDLEPHFAPADHHFYAAVVYTQQNKLRTRLYASAKSKGYRPASYISRHAFVWRDAEIGEHCFVFALVLRDVPRRKVVSGTWRGDGGGPAAPETGPPLA